MFLLSKVEIFSDRNIHDGSISAIMRATLYLFVKTYGMKQQILQDLC